MNKLNHQLHLFIEYKKDKKIMQLTKISECAKWFVE
jgi:hypothetical protein